MGRVGGRVGTSNNSKNSPNTRFFTGNQAIDSAAFGAAAGVAGNYLFNAVTNPCRSGNRNNNKGTNNRIFGGNTGNFLLLWSVGRSLRIRRPPLRPLPLLLRSLHLQSRVLPLRPALRLLRQIESKSNVQILKFSTQINQIAHGSN